MFMTGSVSLVIYSWLDPDNTQRLLAGIEEDSEIKKALYPVPGAKTSTKVAKPKIEFQARLAEYTFADHPQYGPAYRADMESGDKKRQQAWAIKVKNRLVQLVNRYRLSL